MQGRSPLAGVFENMYGYPVVIGAEPNRPENLRHARQPSKGIQDFGLTGHGA